MCHLVNPPLSYCFFVLFVMNIYFVGLKLLESYKVRERNENKLVKIRSQRVEIEKRKVGEGGMEALAKWKQGQQCFC